LLTLSNLGFPPKVLFCKTAAYGGLGGGELGG
jgi:hypothetical protein